MNIGDKLESLNQGVHKSLESGKYEGNGSYSILMIDGGDSKHFIMTFRLTAEGGGVYTFQRIDCGDPSTKLKDVGNNSLKGGDYTLNFSSH